MTPWVVATPAHADPTKFLIRNGGNGKCLEADRYTNPFGDGDPVIQRTCDFDASQVWTRAYLGNGIYYFVNAQSTMCLDVRDGIPNNGTPIQQWECRGSRSMKWFMNPNDFNTIF